MGKINLVDNAILHHDDEVRNGHSLFLIVSNKDGGDPCLPLDAAQFLAGLQTQTGIQIGKRLVQQQDARHLHQRTGNGHTLLLTARKLAGFAIHQALQLHQLCCLQRHIRHLLFGELVLSLAVFQRKGDILLHGQMGIQGVILENKTNTAILRRQVRHIIIAEENFAGCGLQKTRQKIQSSRFTAAGRT